MEAQPMKRALLFSIFLLVSFAARATAQSSTPKSQQPGVRPAPVQVTGPAAAQTARASITKLPLSFEKNLGQTDARVKYVSRGVDYDVFLTSDEAVLALHDGSRPNCIRHDGRMDRDCVAAEKAKLAKNGAQESVLWLRMLGANGSAQVVGSDEQRGKINYYIGNDPKKWHAGVPLFARVTYRGVYPGVDLTYFGNEQQLESDFMVAPGANPRTIEFEVAGAKQIRLDAGGNLILTTKAGDAELLRPGVYQTIGGERRSVAGHYVLLGGNRVGFRFGAYDTHKSLVIDPTLIYATYLGGSALFGADMAQAITADSTGTYVTGFGTSTDFPGADPYGPVETNEDGFAFVTKFDPTGSILIYSTLLGGTDGYNTGGNGIGVDSSHNAYFAGVTEADDFPTLNPFQATFGAAQETAFVASLANDGTLAYSTFFGGRNSSDVTEAMGLFADASGNTYVVGDTNSENFPTLDPIATSSSLSAMGDTDVIVAKFNPQGQPIYSTYLSGTTFEQDKGNAIAADAGGNAYVTGATDSTTWPVVPSTTAFQRTNAGGYDAFVTKLSFSSSTLTIAASTYLGGSGNDYSYGIAVDSLFEPVVTGSTDSSGTQGFPTKNPIFSTNGGGTDAFVTKVSANFTALVFSTYLGGTGSDIGQGVALDSASPPNVYVAGSTTSTNFPLASPLQATIGNSGANTNAFVTILNGAGSAVSFSTYVGGNAADEAYGIFVDTSDNTYIAGETTSPNFPVQGSGGNSPYQGQLASTTGNAFVAEISQTPPTAGLDFFPISFNFREIGVGQTSFSEPVTLSNNSGSSVTISGITVGGSNPGDFAETNNCPATFAAGATCTVTVTFSPTTQDKRTATINVSSTAANNGTVALSGMGAVPELSLSSTSLNFGTNLPLNVQAFDDVEITNTGGVSLLVGSLQLTGTNPTAFTLENLCTGALSPGGSCFIEVLLTPTAGQAYSANLVINDDAAGSPQTVTLAGTGVSQVTVGPPSEEYFGELLNTSTIDRDFFVENGSGGNITLTSITPGGADPGDFHIDANNSTCGNGVTLLPGETCTLDVYFEPTAASGVDGRTATYTFNWTGTASGSQMVTVMGAGEVGVSLYYTTYTAQSEYVGVSTGSNGFDILFNGTVNPITITSIVLSGNNPTDFTASFDPSCSPNGVIAANSTCTLDGSFTPSAVGLRTVTATINYTSGGIAQTPLVLTASGTGLPGPVTFPSTLAFGSEIMGTTTPKQRVFLENLAKVPLTINSITLPANADFAVVASSTTCSSTPGSNVILGGGKCDFDLTFTPSTTTAESTTLVVNDSGPNSPRTLTITGTGEAPVITISANPVDFGNVVDGRTGNASFYLTNGGSTPTTISVAPALTPPGTPFALVTTGGSAGTCVASKTVLPSGGTCSVVLTFKPTAPGEALDSVTLTDSVGGLHTVNIQGNGVLQGLQSLAPTPLTFNQLPSTTTNPPLTTTLTNLGNGPLTIIGTTILGDNAPDFAIVPLPTTTCNAGSVIPASPGPGNTCVVAVTFTAPTTLGTYKAELEVESNIGNGLTSTTAVLLNATVSTSGPAGFSVSPAPPVAFGTVALGTTNTSAEYQLTNNNTVPVTFTSLTFSPTSPDFSVPSGDQDCTTSGALSTGVSCYFFVQFVPSSTASQTPNLQFNYTNAAGLPTSPFNVAVSGTGSNTVVVNPNPVAFSPLTLGSGITSADIQVSITNGATTPAVLNSVSGITGAGQATLSELFNSCTNGQTLTASDGQCTLNIQYAPTATGTNGAASFTVNYTPKGGSPTNIVVPITATAIAPVATVTTPASGAPLAFGSQVLNTESQVEYVTITNSGTAPLTFTSEQIAGNDFSEAAPNYNTYCLFMQLQPGQSCTLPIAFTPAQAGARTGTLTITDGSFPTGTQTVTLNGTGIAGSVFATPTTLTFPATNVGSSVTLAAVLSNTTGAPVAFSGVSFTSGVYTIDATQTVNACVNGKSLPSITGTCAIYIKFTPSGATNSAMAQVATGVGTVTINLNGTGSNPIVTVSPSSVTFSAPQITHTTSGAMTVTLTNGTTSSVTISSATPPGLGGTDPGDFAIASGTTCVGGFVVTASNTCVVNITFTPTQTGTRTATLTVTDSPDANSPHGVTLSGTGTAPSSVAAVTGTTPQSAVVNTAFATLQALVEDSGSNPLSGVTVNFAVTPAGNGASGTFTGGVTTAQATTNSSGIAMAPTFTANSLPGGPYTVAATVSGVATPANFSLTNTAGTPASIIASAGTPQSVAINTQFPTLLQATVEDSHSLPLGGITVTFTAPSTGPSGTFANGTNTTTALTNALGMAQATAINANGTFGGPYNVTASAGALAPVDFSLTNLPGPPASVTANAGSNQSATVTVAFGTALQALVKDGGGNALTGVVVTFTAPASGASGTFANGTITTTATTNGSGLATASTFTANTIAGGPYTVSATAGAATPGNFSLTNNAGSAATITATAGSGQSATVGTAFATLLQATVKDSHGNLVPNVTVTFTAPASGNSGTFANGTNTTNATTNASGVAMATAFTANSTAGGPYSVVATSGTATSANFSLTNNPGAAATITATAGSGQSPTVGTAFATLLQATVKDSDGNLVPNVSVTFTAPASGASGTFANGTNTTTASTNSSGVAMATAFTANTVAGSYSVTASATGATSGTFSLTNTAGAAANISATAGTPQNTGITAAFGTLLQATVTDSHSNPVSGVSVTFTAPASPTVASGTFANGTNTTTATTNASGLATATTFTANTVSGTYNVAASASGLTTVNFSLTNNAGAASTVTATAGTPQSMAVKTAFPTLLQATVKDSHGNLVPNVSVTFTAPASGASGTFANGTITTIASTNASGVATATTFTANSVAGTYNVTATATGATTSGTFALTNQAGSAAIITVSGGASQSVPVNTSFATLQVTVTDSSNNPVSGTSVTFTAPSSAPSGTFANGTSTTTATTNSSGIAAASLFTADDTSGGPYTVTAAVTGISTPGDFSLTNLAGTPASITVTAGSNQSAQINVTFATALSATVKDSSSLPLSGVVVTFTAPSTGASGTFANGTNTTTATTNTSGVATASAFTANSTAGGPYNVGAVAGTLSAVNFSLTNTPGPPAKVTASAGATQSVTVNTAFAQMQATVVDSGGNALSGVTVTFTAPSGAGVASGTFGNGTNTTTAVTNSSGVATPSTFTANTVAGGPYTVTATTGTATMGTFSFTNLAGAAATITATAGSNQSVAVNTAFANLQATVKDSFGNPIANASVVFTAPSSGASGTFANGTITTTIVTGAAGVAIATTFTANNTVGGPYNVTAATGALTPADFSLTNLAGTPASITLTSGSNQSVAINLPFAPLEATVEDKNGIGLSGVVVTFTAPSSGASGTFANGTNTTTALTNSSGLATATTFTANGTSGGPYNVTASAGTLTPIDFVLTNLSGPPASIAATAGSTQSIAIGTQFPTALQATVKDAGGNLLSGVVITFTVTAATNGASGTFANGTGTTTATTGSNGAANASAFIANSIAGGPYTVTASVSGLTQQAAYSLTNLTGPAATITATAGGTQSTIISTPFGTGMQVTVKDSGGNLVNNATVTFTVNPAVNGATGTFTGGLSTVQVTTNASGVTTAPTFTAGSVVGSYTVTASSGTATSATFNLTNLVGPPASIAATTGTPQSTPVTTAYPTNLQATVKDSGGNLVGAATVTFTIVPVNGAGGTFSGGGGSVQAQTNASGVATATVLTANATGGTFTVNATVTGVAAPAVFTLTNTVAPDVTITKSHSGDFVVGTNGTYTFKVTNNGTGPTTGPVTVTDVLPSNLTFVSNTGTGWACSANGQTVTCLYTGAALAAAGGNSTFTISVSVAPGAFPSVTNSVTVSDPNDSKTTDKSFTDAVTNIDNAVPTLTPFPAGSGLIAGATSAQQITITGTGLNSSTVVTFGSFTITGGTANAAGTTLTITIPTADLATAGNITVSVKNPANPNTSNGGGTSGNQTFPVVGFSLQVASGTANPLPVVAGTPAMVQFTMPITPAGAGLPAAVTVACTVPTTETSLTCVSGTASFAQGATSASGTVTITAVPTKSSHTPPGTNRHGPWTPYLLWLSALALALMAGMLALPRQRALQIRRSPAYLMLMLLALSTAVLAGCAGNSGPTPTPTGPSFVTVTATTSDGAMSNLQIPIDVSN
jgi:hypothetical protein